MASKDNLLRTKANQCRMIPKTVKTRGSLTNRFQLIRFNQAEMANCQATNPTIKEIKAANKQETKSNNSQAETANYQETEETNSYKSKAVTDSSLQS